MQQWDLGVGERLEQIDRIVVIGYRLLVSQIVLVAYLSVYAWHLWRTVRAGGKINPLIGAAGISAYPMAARVVQKEGQKYNKLNFLLMHAVGANTGGQVGSVMAAAIMLSVLHGMGII